ncbi:MAG: 2,3,4,5-tetrahydropyridine-2,6-dicarboxylate N-acetyltransferase [bacterium]|nr:2,3,4,5-tetrahydropyridine-2,6-dicarboxylate N-acetyltransferase [bacterium]
MQTQRITADVRLGTNVKIYDFVNLYGCAIGENTKIGTFVEIQKGVTIGKNCKISSHTFICEGVMIEDEVFIGHNVTFINDVYPRATEANGKLQTETDWVCIPTRVKAGASIGSGATLLCGITVGENAIVGAGSVVTKDVPPNTIVAGNPARVLRKIHDSNPASAAGKNDDSGKQFFQRLDKTYGNSFSSWEQRSVEQLQNF